MDLFAALNWRYAVRAFSEQKVPDKTLKALLDATRLSASSYGLQPYSLIVVESDEVREKLVPFSYGQDKVLNSSHLVVFAVHEQIGDETVDRYFNKYQQITGKPYSSFQDYSDHVKQAFASKTEEQKRDWAHQQAYIALGQFLTSAAMLKIDSCPMGGIDQQGYDQVLNLKQKALTTTVVCPIGYRHPDDHHAVAPKVRFEHHEMVMEI
ncbi:NAD(P)H-dependent oxidoreductase [Thiomicrorhabdus sp.]|uniref:NAD(P)H-dependent oxidoreductase n=1 Tax=Thiomicrorhabdus sp. TaxID=2039724 RepID=UPI0029C86C73|nr:NAD(P)H-dependent oxidoreductase [Thiomicrorhabdus sp.]